MATVHLRVAGDLHIRALRVADADGDVGHGHRRRLAAAGEVREHDAAAHVFPRLVVLSGRPPALQVREEARVGVADGPHEEVRAVADGHGVEVAGVVLYGAGLPGEPAVAVERQRFFRRRSGFLGLSSAVGEPWLISPRRSSGQAYAEEARPSPTRSMPFNRYGWLTGKAGAIKDNTGYFNTVPVRDGADFFMGTIGNANACFLANLESWWTTGKNDYIAEEHAQRHHPRGPRRLQPAGAGGRARRLHQHQRLEGHGCAGHQRREGRGSRHRVPGQRVRARGRGRGGERQFLYHVLHCGLLLCGGLF